MERRSVNNETTLSAFDALQTSRYLYNQTVESTDISFTPSEAYAKYHKFHKVLVGENSVGELIEIHTALKNEEVPDYLDVSAWAATEAALVGESMTTIKRMELVHQAEEGWQRAIDFQEILNHTDSTEYLKESVASYRFAINLAFAPLFKSLIAGNVTDAVREKVFQDVLAIAQVAGVQRYLADKAGDQEEIGDYLGFEHECNAYLALFQMNDPRYLPLPSSARGGSGYDYANQTHDLTVVSQHWGEIRNIIPIEVKSKASLADIVRYDALIVRGKMHLSVTGKYTPEHTRNAIAAFYEGTASTEDNRIVYQVISTFGDLLRLYKAGKATSHFNSPTKFHDKAQVASRYPEFSFDRAKKY